MAKRKTKNKRSKKQQNIVIPFLILVLLIGGVLLTSKTILNDIKTSISINKIKDITFNYTKENDTIITVSNKKINDKEAINSDKKYNIKISGNKGYKIRLIDVSNNIPSKYIKVYLTDYKDSPLDNYNKAKTLDKIEKTSNGKIIYKGNSNINKELNLRIWIDKNYKGNKEFSYKLVIE